LKDFEVSQVQETNRYDVGADKLRQYREDGYKAALKRKFMAGSGNKLVENILDMEEEGESGAEDTKKSGKWRKKGEESSGEEEEEQPSRKKGTLADQEKVDALEKKRNLFLGES